MHRTVCRMTLVSFRLFRIFWANGSPPPPPPRPNMPVRLCKHSSGNMSSIRSPTVELSLATYFSKLTSSPLSSGVRSSTAPEITLQRQSRSARYPRSIGVPADSAIFKKSRGINCQTWNALPPTLRKKTSVNSFRATTVYL